MPTNKPQPIQPGMERPPGLPTSPPPPKVGSNEYYKAKIQELSAWLASKEAEADAAEKQAAENDFPIRQTHQAGRGSMAFRTRCWIHENIKGLK
jgi:hypothetical protein